MTCIQRIHTFNRPPLLSLWTENSSGIINAMNVIDICYEIFLRNEGEYFLHDYLKI